MKIDKVEKIAEKLFQMHKKYVSITCSKYRLGDSCQTSVYVEDTIMHKYFDSVENLDKWVQDYRINFYNKKERNEILYRQYTSLDKR